MKTADCKALAGQAAAVSDRLLMSFSMGADSLAMFLRVMESEVFDMSKAVLYFLYYIPHLSWQDEYLAYFEDRYKVKVVRVPGSIFFDHFAYANLQTPGRVEGVRNLGPKSVVPMELNDIEDSIKAWAKLPKETLCAVGVKSGDSAMRRLAMRRVQGWHPAKGVWYPIWDYENSDVYNAIRRHNLKVPYDYELFGITFENIDYRFSKVIKDRCPNNYRRLKEWFPLLDTVIARHEKYRPAEYPKIGVKRAILRNHVLEPMEPL